MTEQFDASALADACWDYHLAYSGDGDHAQAAGKLREALAGRDPYNPRGVRVFAWDGPEPEGVAELEWVPPTRYRHPGSRLWFVARVDGGWSWTDGVGDTDGTVLSWPLVRHGVFMEVTR